MESAPASAGQFFGSGLAAAQRYAEILVTTGVERGLIGPREADRIWSRHVVNCAAIVEVFPADARVVDVGSGAGLPGLCLALARPELLVDLVEPLARRAQFLTETVEELELSDRVRVIRGRAEDREVREAVGNAPWVTARAVAPLERLVRWCLPLLTPGGRLVAMKGSQAASEVAEHRSMLLWLGVSRLDVMECGVGVVDPPVTVVLAERGSAERRSKKSKGKS